MGTLTSIPSYATPLQWKWLRRKSKRPAKSGQDEEYVPEEITIRVCVGGCIIQACLCGDQR